MTYRYQDLENLYDGKIPQAEIDLVEARVIYKRIIQAEAWINTCRQEVRRCCNTVRDVHAAPFRKRGLSTDQVFQWQARSIINLRDAWFRYRGAIRARKLLD
jgi:hypothetical protein